jgi:hypothetical protein
MQIVTRSVSEEEARKLQIQLSIYPRFFLANASGYDRH